MALTTSIETARFLSFVWGTKSIVTRDANDFDDMADIVCKTLLEKGYGKKNELTVITAGAPFHSSGRTNLLRIETL